MTYLRTLETELTAVGIPAARRRRILAEFADHLHEDGGAELGAPRELARQFADELGTRLARATAYRVFAVLAITGLGMAAMFLAVGRARALTIYGQQHTPTPTWTAPILLVAALAAQVALASGSLALLRAWRLRREPVISRADATVLVRRATVAAVSGAVTVAALPAAALAFPHAVGATWAAFAWGIATAALVGLAGALPTVLAGARLRPARGGRTGDLIDDLGPWVPAALTPTRCALLLALVIAIVLSAAGVAAQDPYDGALRGIADATACLAGFAVLGRYLGLRTAG